MTDGRTCVILTFSVAIAIYFSVISAQAEESLPPQGEASTPSVSVDPLEPDHTQPGMKDSDHGKDREEETVDPTTSLVDLRDAVQTFPNSSQDHGELADTLYRIGDVDQAIDEYRVALKLNPDSAKTHMQLGVALMAKQDWRAAMTEFKEATGLDPDLTQAHYNLGTVYYTTGNLKAAIQSYQRALELQPAFPDAGYRLALVLKLAHRDQESARFMAEAAQGGVAQAQYFLGNAYRTGQGVEKNGALAVYWWTKSLSLGHQPAAVSLSQLRRQALSSTQPANKRQEALEAFRNYRDRLWGDFPDLPRNGESETLGTTLLKQNRGDEAVSMLLQESYALSEPSQAELAQLYETGREPHLAPFDKRIMTSFEITANDGFLPAKKILALIYAKGIGAPPDVSKAKAQLKGLPRQDAKSIFDQFPPHP